MCESGWSMKQIDGTTSGLVKGLKYDWTCLEQLIFKTNYQWARVHD